MASFALVNGIALYGGFAGYERSFDERNVVAYRTVLSGDIGVPGVMSDNCYHVVTTNTTIQDVQHTILDGFTVTGGLADGSPPENRGGGMYNHGGAPAVVNCLFTGNRAQLGGGMFNYGCDPVVLDSTFEGNSSYYRGGAMGNWKSSPTIANCLFVGNWVDTAAVNGSGGGAMHNDSDALVPYSYPVITDCLFIGNRSSYWGGAMLNQGLSRASLLGCRFLNNSSARAGGAVLNYETSNTRMSNCVVIGNTSLLGGGMRSGNSDPTTINCTFVGNRATQPGGGGGMLNLTATDRPVIVNCILWGNTDGSGSTGQSAQIANGTPRIDYSCVQGWTGSLGGVGNFGADPRFVDAAGADGVFGTEDDDVRLAAGSPCVDAGTDAPPGGLADTDVDGRARVLDGDGDGQVRVDIGACER